MHLLSAKPGQVSDGTEAIDLEQSAGDIVIISAAETELVSLSDAWAAKCRDGDNGDQRLRLANMMKLQHNYSVDLYLEQTAASAKIIVARLLGGMSYWSYGCDELRALAQRTGAALLLLPGDGKPDEDLRRASSDEPALYDFAFDCLRYGGSANARLLLDALTDRLADEKAMLPDDAPAAPLPAGCYQPGTGAVSLSALKAGWTAGQPVAAIVFYAAHMLAGNTQPVDALAEALAARGLNPLPLYAGSLKDPAAAAVLAGLLDQPDLALVLNTTGFAVGKIATDDLADPVPTVLDASGRPVLQVVMSTAEKAAWRENVQGLSPRDLAMNVALPEVDGRVLTRAISFKGAARFDDATEAWLTRYEPVADRVAFVADLAANQAKLATVSAAEKCVAIELANYPTKRARVGNGVGLDTPASLINILTGMQAAGYDLGHLDPRTAFSLVLDGPLNDPALKGAAGESLSLPLAEYRAWFSALPETVRMLIMERWGDPADDPHVANDAFTLAIHRFGNVLISVQPARGYNLDPETSYHDPDLPPPHRYLAHYCLLQSQAHAVVHLGKHGNLEWLPGKALALSTDCLPEVALGPLPHFYPFIVNDPGEGSQAKRRSQAVILDHMTPPLTRAELYGDLTQLEQLVDEFFTASQLDPRRLKGLRRDIRSLLISSGLDKELGIETGDDDAALEALDNYLCELKELQIRDGLHIFGSAPEGDQARDLAVAQVRLPRGDGKGARASLLTALCEDFGLAFDPLDCSFADLWTGARPEALAEISDASWRTTGDTLERLELLSHGLVEGTANAPGPASAAVIRWVQDQLLPVFQRSADDETGNLLKGLAGEFVPPGPSGAPTRGRLDVLPTGRNFYSVDSRAVPTPAAWKLGRMSADLLATTYMQEHGEPLLRLTLSAWGTSNMRTGGDDIAQALALMGVQPKWDGASGRVTGFEIISTDLLGRPRTDVTLRVSGFFRDAFPFQMDLFDSAARAVAVLDEPDHLNPLAAAVREERQTLSDSGLSADDAALLAGARLFGSKPGAYGAGLQALIDEGVWSERKDLAEAYLEWSGYAYGGKLAGKGAGPQLRARLKHTQAIAHNQDNREHDLLDSDDYYQFEGGLAAAVWALQGEEQPVYHNDHSRPERPVIRSLEQELDRIVRGRAANPKWIAGVMRHGYKGAFEIAATVDYLFGFAASSGRVADRHFDQLHDAYILDGKVRDFLERENPDALRDIEARFQEAIDRGLWTPRRNSLTPV